MIVADVRGRVGSEQIVLYGRLGLRTVVAERPRAGGETVVCVVVVAW